MNAITILAVILFALMIIFGGKKGLVSFLTLFLNFVILLFAIIFIVLGAPVYIVTVIFCIAVAACNLSLIHI